MVSVMVYDCVIVIGGNIVRTDDGRYQPTDYTDSDQFGMYGGKMRVITAAWMYVKGLSNTFLFSAGISEKTKAAFGPDVPIEAVVYSQAFQSEIECILSGLDDGNERNDLTIVIEDRSKNTVDNIKESLAIINQYNWQSVAVLSSDVHIPRLRALTELITKSSPIHANLTFLGAETMVKKLRPGKYDGLIDYAHNSPEGKKRAKNEAQGLADIHAGRYVLTEFQLHKRST